MSHLGLTWTQDWVKYWKGLQVEWFVKVLLWSSGYGAGAGQGAKPNGAKLATNTWRKEKERSKLKKQFASMWCHLWCLWGIWWILNVRYTLRTMCFLLSQVTTQPLVMEWVCMSSHCLLWLWCCVSVECQVGDVSYWSSQVAMEELAPSPTKVMDDLHSVRTFRPWASLGRLAFSHYTWEHHAPLWCYPIEFEHWWLFIEIRSYILDKLSCPFSLYVVAFEAAVTTTHDYNPPLCEAFSCIVPPLPTPHFPTLFVVDRLHIWLLSY